jgi:hypothetical protein
MLLFLVSILEWMEIKSDKVMPNRQTDRKPKDRHIKKMWLFLVSILEWMEIKSD